MILARIWQAMVDTFLKLKHEAEESGLIMNENNTKFIKCFSIKFKQCKRRRNKKMLLEIKHAI